MVFRTHWVGFQLALVFGVHPQKRNGVMSCWRKGGSETEPTSWYLNGMELEGNRTQPATNNDQHVEEKRTGTCAEINGNSREHRNARGRALSSFCCLRLSCTAAVMVVEKV